VSDIVQTFAGDTQGKLLALLRREPRTVNELAAELGLTDNAIRAHLAALGRDGMVEDVGAQRDTGGKPARRYALTLKGEELFPKAYAVALNGLVEEIARTEGWERAATLLRGVGTRLSAGVVASGGVEGRVEAAATALRGLGAEIDLATTATGWELQGHACPLSRVTADHPQVCGLVTAIVAEITGRPVAERCDREGKPRCRFEVTKPS
jgi:predicted ArsR family transcriptional regulator